MMGSLAYLNGMFCPIAEAKVSIEDRGFQFGDSVYEVVVTYDGRPFLLDPHMKRMARSAAQIGLDYDFEDRPLEPIIEEGLRRSGIADAVVYIQLTRGVAPRAHAVPDHPIEPTVVMTFKPRPPVSPENRQRGVSVITVLDDRWARCFIKAVTLLPNVLAKTEAVRRGFYDALFVSPGGEVREATSANVFVVRDRRIAMPPRDESVLHGITQGFIMECAEAIDIPIEERVIRREDLPTADEAFLSNTMVEVMPVTRIDDHPVGDGTVGPVTKRVYEEFGRRVRANCREVSAPPVGRVA
jgi:D-alanine transaminase